MRPGLLTHNAIYINRLEAIQRRTTKFILKSNEGYITRLSLLNVQSTLNKRFTSDVVVLLVVLFNLINGHYKYRYLSTSCLSVKIVT